MLAGPQDHTIDGIFVKPQQPRGCTNTDTFGRVVNNLPNRVGRQMQAEQRAGASSGKSLPTGAAVQQVTFFVLAVFAANANVVMPAQAVILALFIGAEVLIEFVHGLPPALKWIYWRNPTIDMNRLSTIW